MFNPPHPGILLKHSVIVDEDGIFIDTLDGAAIRLDHPAIILESIINGELPITTRLALALENNGNGNAEMWCLMQCHYDLWHLRNPKT